MVLVGLRFSSFDLNLLITHPSLYHTIALARGYDRKFIIARSILLAYIIGRG
jgi:hypothetical protein